jgi:hypothetical protein
VPPAAARPEPLPPWKRERGRKKTGGDKNGAKKRCAAGEDKQTEGKRQDKEEKKRRTDGLSQGPNRKYRKLQGLDCKTKFSVDLKPK